MAKLRILLPCSRYAVGAQVKEIYSYPQLSCSVIHLYSNMSQRTRSSRRHNTRGSKTATSTSTNLGVNIDIIMLIAQHTEYHIMLGLLAAYPSPEFARGLYIHTSDFWCKRLGAQTGYGCLTKDDGTGKHATDAPWTPKMQHDALTQRSGYLVLSFKRPYHTEPLLLSTNRRVKAVVDASDLGKDGVYNLAVVALWEDGTVRVLSISLQGDEQYVISTIEDDSAWVTAVAADYLYPDQPLYSERSDVPYSRLPRMKMMLSPNPYTGILALDYDGVVWRMSRDSLHIYEDDVPFMARVSGPATVVNRLGEVVEGEDADRGDIGRIVHLDIIQSNPASAITIQTSQLIPVVTNEDGERYMLRIIKTDSAEPYNANSHIKTHTPVYMQLSQTVKGKRGDVLYDANAVARMVGEYRPTQEHGWDDDGDRLLYPQAPYIITRTYDDKSLIVHRTGKLVVRGSNPIEEYRPMLDRDRMGVLQGIAQSDVLVTYTTSPTLVLDAVEGPTKDDATIGDIVDLRGMARADTVVHLVPLAPKWFLGLTGWIVEMRELVDADIMAIDHYAQVPFIETIATDRWGSRGLVHLLRSDGSVDVMNEARKLEKATDRIVVEGREYGVVKVKLSGAIGRKLRAMVHIGRSWGNDESLCGIGV